jgi:hypothetical protein
MRSDDVRRWLDGDTFDFAHLRSLGAPPAEFVAPPTLPVLVEVDAFSFGHASQAWQESPSWARGPDPLGHDGDGRDWHHDVGQGWQYGDGSGAGKGTTNQGIASGTTPPPYGSGDGFSNINGDPVTHDVFSPPDNALAVSVVNGQKYYVSMVNDTMGMGTSLSPNTMQFQAFSQFFPTNLVNGLFFTDPQAVLDTTSQKFILAEATYKSSSSTVGSLLLAASHDAVPMHGFDFFSINMQVTINGKKTGIDYPQLDVDGTNYFVTTDQYNGNTEVAPLVTVGTLASIESGPTTAPLPIKQFVPPTPVVMPLDVAALPGKGAFFVGYSGYSKSGHDYVTIDFYSDATGKTTSGVYDVGAIDNLAVKTLVATQPDGHQLDASDRRVNDVKVIGNDLYVVTETVPFGTGAKPTVTIFDFSLQTASGTVDPTKPHLVDTWTVPGSILGTGVTTMYGSIAGDLLPDGSRELVVNFMASGPSLTMSDYFMVHKATDTTPGAFFEAPVQYATSPTSYSDGSKISRAGDYSSATLVAPHEVAVSNEYAVDAGHWGTKIADVWLLNA